MDDADVPPSTKTAKRYTPVRQHGRVALPAVPLRSSRPGSGRSRRRHRRPQGQRTGWPTRRWRLGRPARLVGRTVEWPHRHRGRRCGPLRSGPGDLFAGVRGSAARMVPRSLDQAVAAGAVALLTDPAGAAMAGTAMHGCRSLVVGRSAGGARAGWPPRSTAGPASDWRSSVSPEPPARPPPAT